MLERLTIDIKGYKVGEIIRNEYTEIFTQRKLFEYWYILYDFNSFNVVKDFKYPDYPTTATTQELAEYYVNKSFVHCINLLFRTFKITEKAVEANYGKSEDFTIHYYDVFYKNKPWGFISDFNLPKGKYQFICHVFPPLINRLLQEKSLPPNQHQSFEECRVYAQQMFNLFARALAKDFTPLQPF